MLDCLIKTWFTTSLYCLPMINIILLYLFDSFRVIKTLITFSSKTLPQQKNQSRLKRSRLDNVTKSPKKYFNWKSSVNRFGFDPIPASDRSNILSVSVFIIRFRVLFLRLFVQVLEMEEIRRKIACMSFSNFVVKFNKNWK